MPGSAHDHDLTGGPAATAPAVPRTAWWCLALGTVAAVFLIGRVLYLCGAGIDFTDEGYYLNWITHPGLYPVSPSLFGFVYSPLYWLAGQDLVLLRQINVLLTVGCGWAFFSVLLRDQWQPAGRERCAWLGLALILSVSSLTTFYYWLPTPNYNTLALQGLLLGGCGLGLARRDLSRTMPWGHLLLGMAAALTFLGKPTTAALAAPLFILCLAARRELSWRGFLTMSLTTFLCVAVVAGFTDASVTKFYARLAGAAADAAKLQSTYTFAEILRLDPLGLTREETVFLGIAAAFTGITSWLATSVRSNLRLASIILTLVFLAGFLLVVGVHHFRHPSLLSLLGHELTPLFSYSSSHDWMNCFRSAGVLLLAWPLGILIATVARLPRRPALAECTAALCFLVIPYAYVAGTNGNYWAAMGGAAIFWCAGGVKCLALVPGVHWPRFLPLAAAILAGTVLILIPATEAPYRQSQPLRKNTVVVTMGGTSEVRVPADIANYIRTVQSQLAAAGFQPGDPMIDLTGHYPTLLHIINARPIGVAWLLGGYPGSEAFVRGALDRVPRVELQRAWIITEPEGPRKISSSVLGYYGLDLDRDYAEVGFVDSPIADFSRPLRQYLYKPKASGTQ